MQFESADAVEDHFGTAFTNDQYVLITNYLMNGTIPAPDGCMGCDAAYIRMLIGRMQAEPEPEPKAKSAARNRG